MMNIKKGYVSIIVPVYNVKDYLQECVDSILAQTYNKIEAIFIDDGSNDGSGRILDRYAGNENVRVVHQSNKGVSGARNEGLKRATGEFVTFVDADDRILPNYIEKLVEGIEDYDMAVCNMPAEWNKGFGIKQTKKEMARVFEINGYTWGKLLRKKDIDIQFLNSVKYAEDYIFYINICNKIENINVMDYYGYFYRVRPGSLSVKQKGEAHTEREFYNKLTFLYGQPEIEKAIKTWNKSGKRVVRNHCYYINLLLLMIYYKSGVEDEYSKKKIREELRSHYSSFVWVTLLKDLKIKRFIFGTTLIMMPKTGAKLASRLLG